MPQLINIENFFGGFARSERKGKAGEFAYGQELDILGDIDVIRPQFSQQANDADLAAGTDIRDFAILSDGNIYAYGRAGSDDNDIHIRRADDSGGSWTVQKPLVSTTDFPQDGRLLAEGANFYYWYKNDTVNKVKVSVLGALGSEPTNDATGTITEMDSNSDRRGPMLKGSDGKRYFAWWDDSAQIGYLAQNAAGAANYSLKALLPVPFEIISLANWRTYMLILAKDENNNESALFVWDFVKSTFIDRWNVPSGTAKTMRVINEVAYIFADDAGTLKVYEWTGGQMQLKKSWKPSQKMTGLATDPTSITLYDAAVDVKGGIIYFGASFVVSASTGLSGIFAFGSYDSEYPLAFWHDRQPGTAGTSDFFTIYAIKWAGSVLWTSYINIGDSESSPTVHIWITSSSYSTTAYLETSAIDFGLYRAEVPKVILNYRPLAASDAITLYARKDGLSTWTSLGTATTDSATFSQFPITGNFKNIQFKIAFTGGRPEITGLYGEGNLMHE